MIRPMPDFSKILPRTPMGNASPLPGLNIPMPQTGGGSGAGGILSALGGPSGLMGLLALKNKTNPGFQEDIGVPGAALDSAMAQKMDDYPGAPGGILNALRGWFK